MVFTFTNGRKKMQYHYSMTHRNENHIPGNTVQLLRHGTLLNFGRKLYFGLSCLLSMLRPSSLNTRRKVVKSKSRPLEVEVTCDGKQVERSTCIGDIFPGSSLLY